MPKFQVTVADETGHKHYDELIEADSPKEACAKSIMNSSTADVDHFNTVPYRLNQDPEGSQFTESITLTITNYRDHVRDAVGP